MTEAVVQMEALILTPEYRNLPVLNGDFLGNTQYIDQIPINRINAPLMRGMDRNRRPFLVFCCDIIDTRGHIYHTTTVCFRRFRDTPGLWVFVACDGRQAAFSGLVDPKRERIIRDLLFRRQAHIQAGEELVENISHMRAHDPAYPINLASKIDEFLSRAGSRLSHFVVPNQINV